MINGAEFRDISCNSAKLSGLFLNMTMYFSLVFCFDCTCNNMNLYISKLELETKQNLDRRNIVLSTLPWKMLNGVDCSDFSCHSAKFSVFG